MLLIYHWWGKQCFVFKKLNNITWIHCYCTFTGVWHEGDCCLAPNPRDGVPREATIQRLSSTSHSNDTAWVIFAKDVEEEKQEEEAIPVLKLTRPGLNHFTQEKPMFPASIIDSSLCIPLKLNGEDSVPYTINRYLRDYQREGIRFIYNNYISSYGCILGDDMGLGKTVQVQRTWAAKLIKELLKYEHLFLTWLSVFHSLLLFAIGHWFSCCCVAQNRHMGGHREQQASVSAESVTL